MVKLDQSKSTSQVVSKSQIAYNSIRDAIISNKYPAGTLLSERDLSIQLDLSRTPVKDALRKLAFEGYVDLYPDKGAFVSMINFDDIIELYEIRQAIEGFAAYLAAERCQEKDIYDLEEYLMQQRRLANAKITDNYEYERLFHLTITQSSQNHRMLAYLETIMNQCARTSCRIQNDIGRVNRSIEQHQAIFDAIKARDPENAMKAMHLHIGDVIKTTKDLQYSNHYLFKASVKSATPITYV